MAAKNKVEVRIGGKDYILVGSESDEYIQKVALYIDKKMNEVTRMNNKLSTSLAAVLTAVNVADDLFKIQQREANLTGELERTKEELEQLRTEVKKLSAENSTLLSKNKDLQIELAKREAELKEVRNSIEKYTRLKG
ncbi:MAG TPA: cell division protein ZapA [Clostridiaceae bacterium]|nr:cell division protein ZapA [Clostridiaceae bacterium]